jgi:hypothetical protein
MNNQIVPDNLPMPVRIVIAIIRWIVLFVAGLLFFVLVAKIMFSMDIEPSSRFLGWIFLAGGIICLACVNKFLIAPAIDLLVRFFSRKPAEDLNYFR